jgi:hypothetical protein
MGMNAAILRDAIKAKLEHLQNVDPRWTDPPPPDGTGWTVQEKSDQALLAYCEAIIEHIQNFANLEFRASDVSIQTSTAPGSPTGGPAGLIPLLPGNIK